MCLYEQVYRIANKFIVLQILHVKNPIVIKTYK
jgi:hypothetical protein